MAVDILRSCYSSEMRLFKDHPEILTPVQWYFVEPNFIPYATLFGADLWPQFPRTATELGELTHGHRWKGGYAPKAVATSGLCGTEDQWLSGCLTTDPVPASYPGTTVPVCCSPPPQGGIGGQVNGGFATNRTCLGCENMPQTVYLTITIVSGSCPDLNGAIIPLTVIDTPCSTLVGGFAYYCSPPFLCNGNYFRAVLGCVGTPTDIFTLYVVTGDCSAQVGGNLILAGPAIVCLPAYTAEPSNPLPHALGCGSARFTATVTA